MMCVPTLRPILSVLVEGVEEEVMQEPEMVAAIGIKSAMLLQLEEEGFPFAAITTGNIKPKTFDAGVMDTPLENGSE